METDAAPRETPLDDLRRQLEAEPTGLPWPSRRELVGRAAGVLRSGNDGMVAEKLLVMLARDPKWEVRKAVADSLLHAPEALYGQLIQELANDPNTFVSDSVRREMGRRSLQRPAEKRRQPRPLKRLEEEIAARFGPDGLRLATKLADKRMEQLIRSAVHDIKGILTPIQPSLDALQEAVEDKVGKRRAERVAGGIDYLLRLLGDMREWADEAELTKAEEDLVSIIEAAAQDARDHLAAQRRDCGAVAVKIEAPSRPRLALSRPHLQMAFTNLIKNGIEAHAIGPAEFKAGTVTVVVSSEEQVVRIAITDTGAGINVRDLERLLEFLPGNTSKKHLGTGYGLPIAQRRIEAQGGKVTITSAEGHGTTVTVLLPL